MLKLSLITINLNNSDGLKKTIESVESQTFRNFEFIIIDGGSIDGSVDVIRKYSDKINYWISEKDEGIYNAMNKGIKQATGEYCLFLNSGDYLVDVKVLNKVFLKNYLEDILYGNIIIIKGGINLGEKTLPSILTLDFLFNHNIWHPSSLIKRQVFNVVGIYNENYKIASDYDFFFHAIAIEKVTTIYLSFPITVYDMDGISSNPENLNLIEKERATIHAAYLKQSEIEFLFNLKKFKNRAISKWMVNKPKWTMFFNWLLNIYRKIRD